MKGGGGVWVLGRVGQTLSWWVHFILSLDKTLS